MTLDRVEINVVPSADYFPEVPFLDGCKLSGGRIEGLAIRGNRIFIIGHCTPSGRIIVDPEILGHEIQHLMNYADETFINPDCRE